MTDRFGTANVVTAGAEEAILHDLPVTPAVIQLTKWNYESPSSDQRKMATVRVTVGTDTLAAVIDYGILAAAIEGLNKG